MRAHLATLVDDFRRNGQQTAIVRHAGNRRISTSWAALAELSARVAAELARRGIAPGDRVLLWGSNSSEWLAVFFGCVIRGVLVVPLDAAGDTAFACGVLRETSPRLLVGDRVLLDRLTAGACRAGTSTTAEALPFDQFRETLPAPDYTPVDGLDRATPLQIIFTSGTTAAPKGIVHTHGNVLSSLDPIEHEIDRYRRYERFVHPLRFLHTLPLSHVFGQFMGIWVPPLLAAEVHFEARLEASRLLRLIRQEHISVLAAVPRVLELLRTHLLQLAPKLQAGVENAQGLSALKRWWRFRREHWRFGLKFWAIVCGGATLPRDLERFWTTLGFALIQGYGMTETAALVTLNHPFRTARGSIGKPLAGREVEIAPDGEILVRGGSVAEREWRGRAMQPRAQHAGGWLATGDIAERSAAGDLVFTGRKSDVIATAAGLKIHPQDLEGAILQNSAVRDAVVVAYDAGAAGPQPLAVLAFVPGDHASEAEDAITGANAKLAAHQQIRRWLLWPQADFPRTTTGKVMRREIAAWASQTLAAGKEAAPPEHDPLFATLRSLTGARAEGPITDATRLSEDLHLDSLGFVELQTALEVRFGMELDEFALQQARTVADLRRLLQLPVNAPSAPAYSNHSAGAIVPPAKPRTEKAKYPRWPWSPPVRWLRFAFLECVSRPLTRLLLVPRVRRSPGTPKSAAPMLIIANHVTAFDVPLVLYALPGPIRRRVAVAMAGNLLMAWRHARSERHTPLRPLTPFAYLLVTALFNVFPLPQGAGFRRSFEHAGEALDDGMHVLLFPEGRRSADGKLQPFQSGIGLLAQQSAVPVLPVFMEGLGPLKVRQKRWFRSKSVTIYVGEPLSLAPGEDAQSFTHRLESAVRALGTTATSTAPQLPLQSTSR